jgi:glycosyltransferase involved in cell wall biosynthesis
VDGSQIKFYFQQVLNSTNLGTGDSIKICIIVPVHNEQENIAPLAERTMQVINRLSQYSFEILFVDDGSHDKTIREIEKLVEKGLPVGYVQLSRNFGHQSALEAGFSVADADAIITMDGDLQHPPEEIVGMVEKFAAGADVVQMQRKNVGADFRGKLSLAYYTFFKWISDAPLVSNAADFRLVSRRVADEINKIPGKGKLLRAIIPAIGFEQVHTEYLQDERKFGKPSYSLFDLWELALQTTFKFSRFPAHFATITGGMLMLASLVIFLLQATHLVAYSWHRFIITLFVLMLGCGFVGIGIICWYLFFILEQVRSDPSFIVKKVVYPSNKP